MRRLLLLLATAVPLCGQAGESVLLIVNRGSAVSRQTADYYRPRRSVPIQNVCPIDAPSDEEISWDVYQRQIEKPVGDFLKKAGLTDKILYIVLTMGLPLKVAGGGSGYAAEYSSVDSELALLYAKLKGAHYPRAGGVANPFFRKRDSPFRHDLFPIYLVTRLAAYDLGDLKAMIDRSLAARNRGKFVLDLQSEDDKEGNNWLRTGALLIPAARVVLDESKRVLYDQKEVIGYASWGSNDAARTRRRLGFQWLPGAIATEFVSTNARTLQRPPDTWAPTSWQDRAHWFGGSPQGLSADLIHEGATGVSGNVYEPLLGGCIRPDYLLPAYYAGRNLAESFYVAMPYLSWQGVIFGDPLCSLGRP